MLENYDKLSKSAESPVKIGRIAFCTILAAPYAFSAFVVATGADLGNLYFFFLVAIVFLFTCVPLSIVGVVTITRNRLNGQPNVFWYMVTVLALSPIIWLVGNLVFGVLIAKVH